MATSRSADVRGRSLLALLLSSALLVGACGGSSSAAPTDPPNVVATPAQGETPAPTVAALPTISIEDGGTAFGAATVALDALDSYEFRVEIVTSSVVDGVTTDERQAMSGVVVNAPSEAQSLIQQDLDADGNVLSETGIVVIGADAWIRSGGADEPWVPVPAAQAQTFVQLLAGFRPEQMFALYFGGLAANFTSAGSDTKNGVRATKYEGDEAIGAALGAIAGVVGDWTSEVWIADDGGYLVHSEAIATGGAAGDLSGFQIVVDITKPNSAGPILPPS